MPYIASFGKGGAGGCPGTPPSRGGVRHTYVARVEAKTLQNAGETAGFVPGTTKHDFVTTPSYYWDCRTQCTKDLLGPGSNTNCSMWCGPWNDNCNWTQANKDDWLPLDTGCDQQTGLPWRSRALICLPATHLPGASSCLACLQDSKASCISSSVT